LAELSVRSLGGLPEISPGADLGELIVAALAQQPPGHRHDRLPARPRDRSRLHLRDGAVIAIAHKAVSKAEGALVDLREVRPTPRARELAAQAARAGGGAMDDGAGDAVADGDTDFPSQSGNAGPAKDPRAVQVVLDEAAEVIRAERGVIVCRTPHGLVCANAGVDLSNASDPHVAIVLPRDPDASARRVRARLRELTGVAPGVLITDSFGRAWRHGQCDVAIGCAGIAPLDDWRGRLDGAGRTLRATWIAVADAIAAAADLARGKDSGEPVVIVDGLRRFLTNEDGPGAAALIRPQQQDLFR
jgi:coenzyme F420-0:L-glutamate ligase / coenzyme F420-1:gamma-L-glutamate ligase